MHSAKSIIVAIASCFFVLTKTADAIQCFDKPNTVTLKNGKKKTCRFVNRNSKRLCRQPQVEGYCPVVCESTCPKCKDSTENVIERPNGKKKKCKFLKSKGRRKTMCADYNIAKKCPRTCRVCLEGCQDSPNTFKFNGQDTTCSTGDASFCTSSKKKFARNCKKTCGKCIIIGPSPPTQSPTPKQPTVPPTNGTPTAKPTGAPTVTPGSPTKTPTPAPTVTPGSPTKTPTRPPTRPPTNAPTKAPTSSFAYGTDEIVL